MEKWLKADLHIHTSHSFDSLSKVEEVVFAAVERGLGAIAITDHDSISGALEAKRLVEKKGLPIQIIIGEEIKTDRGDLLAYFLRKRIAPGRIEDAIKEAKRQKAVCFAAHPYDFVRHGIDLCSLPQDVLDGIAGVEAFNARATEGMNRKAEKFAAEKGKPAIAGSDAHHVSEIGLAYTLFYEVERLDAKSLVCAKREIRGRRTPLAARLFHSKIASLSKLIWRARP